ncbi:MAG: phosphoribosylformylglycinamidine synthase subunit PurL [Verrucomicrobiota bacterium]
MSAIAEAARTYREVDIRDLGADELVALSEQMKLSLSLDDMAEIQGYYVSEARRNPTDVELEVFAQTWSEHCKHRIFAATIQHEAGGTTETIRSIYKTYIRDTTKQIMEAKPGFVLSAFVDNAGFIKLDENLAVCLKVETHNHPSAIEPYAGANTGLGGVIRDILGAGKGARPIASCDVFCFGAPDTKPEEIKASDVIHPLGVMRGVVRGVRDYGNRMGIPTVFGAIQFDSTYIYNPLVFCGTAGVIPTGDIEKEMKEDLVVLAAGAGTGRDGLHGATFSSAALDTDSHEEDQTAVQIGNPIEEKKVADFLLDAREKGLIEFVTDCGAGGFSSAAGEMLSECGGNLYLENAPLKEEGLLSWEIFLSESQERMVLAVNEKSVSQLEELAATYGTNLARLGEADGSGVLKVWHDGNLVCEIANERLHDAPIKQLQSRFEPVVALPASGLDDSNLGEDLRAVLGDFAIVSREPIIREYDHEVQGNTFQKPLAGATGDAPQDAAVMRIDGSEKLLSLALSLLPEWGKTDPFRMGEACVDETVRQLVASGANPDQIALLDNFCMGNPEDPKELGGLVECAKGIAKAALAFGAPFVSGKDSFYNYFETDEGPVSVPVTCLISGMGIVDSVEHVTSSSLRRPGSVMYLLGATDEESLGGSIYSRTKGVAISAVPEVSSQAMEAYRSYYAAVKEGLVLSAHDLSEGGLAVAAAEMGFSMKAGLELDLPEDVSSAAGFLFSESPSRLLIEVAPEMAADFESKFANLALCRIGSASGGHRKLSVKRGGDVVLEHELEDLKSIWKNGLKRYY